MGEHHEGIEPIILARKIESGLANLYDLNDSVLRDKKSPAIEITLDLSDLTENDYQKAARWLKAFLDSRRGTQSRTAKIRARTEQKNWELNALGSAVEFIKID